MSRDLKDQVVQDLPDLQVPLVLKVFRALLVQQVLKELKVVQVLLDLKDRVVQDLQVRQARQDPQVQLVPPVQLDLLGQRAPPVRQE